MQTISASALEIIDIYITHLNQGLSLVQARLWAQEA